MKKLIYILTIINLFTNLSYATTFTGGVTKVGQQESNRVIDSQTKQGVEFAKEKADSAGVPLLFDTDMKAYAEMYQHFGCKLYNTVTADNGVTRYCLVYERKTDGA